ncbi:multidrug effflux MFS transporter [Calidifontibacillus oryziterrae]|uniref:multidrug effflux MFS transporter n=1 Tax=Calidifontibacillus oryziterrae TaxID=1191699 RepID=UPI00031F9AEF|nr:multidrug effflux MFS transporter [Calidifontibacillus oryziterrae]
MSLAKSQTIDFTKKKNSPNRLVLAFILGFLASIPPFATDFYLPALPQMTTDLSANAASVQLSLTSVLLGMAFGQLIIGPYSDVLGRKIPLTVSFLIFVVSTILCAFSPSIWMLVIFRFFQGFSGAGGVVLSRAIVRDLYSGYEVTKFMAVLTLLNGVITIIAPVAGGQLLKITDWRGIFLFLGIVSFFIFFTVLFGVNESLPDEKRTESGLKNSVLNFGILFKNKLFIGYTLTQGLIFAGFFGYLSASPFVLQDIYGLSAQEYSYSFAINAAGVILATFIAERVVGNFGEGKILIFFLYISLLASLLLLTSILFNWNIRFILLAFFLIFSCMGVISMLSNSLAMQSQEKNAGSASALLGLVPFILGAISAPLVGIGSAHTALPMAIVIASCNIGALVCFKRLVFHFHD